MRQYAIFRLKTYQSGLRWNLMNLSRGLNPPKSAKTRFKFSADLNLETFDTIFSGTNNNLNRGLNLNRRSNSLNSATELTPLSLNSISKLTELKFESNGIKSELKRTVNLILLCVNNKLLSINKYNLLIIQIYKMQK